MIDCDFNDCSRKGKCIKSYESPIQTDICECYEGYTGFDCSSEVSNLKPNPFGDIFPEKGSYYKNDKYGDNHPIYNLSALF